MHWVVRIFAVIGVLATLVFMLIALSFTNVRIGPFSRDYIFNWGGLDPRQPYTVVWDRSEGPSRDGPFEFLCFQLQEGGFSPDDPDRWSWHANDPWEAKVRADVLLDPQASGCIPRDELRSESTALLLWSARYQGQRIDSATAIFYHRPTNRLLFVNWAM